ncbi:response regulator [Euzebyella marina]|uniref:Response regulator n=1 Tax=Euzebyella marina TaxID=1761453 RepID=A0A3G2L440_9FLAO|nr:response regulator [Euzebyella marina]AYN67005.1 response regulator [Euzebyella marina]MBG50662.1 response regulator [Pseudozobellia sp.]|tara:strand:+ start:216 stop:620 length:405 start_codon:yes stop_codon:yes gene_type:complete
MKKIESICIIDDDPITVFGVQKMLSLTVSCDNISSYVNGKKALDGIKKNLEEGANLPQVIFLDINMPIMDGWQFLEEFIALPSEEKVRINIITSSIDAHDKEKWEHYQTRTDHLITYNNKPLYKQQIAEITQKA